MSVAMIGLDTAKSVFQVHAVDEAGKVAIRRKLRRSELIAFFEKQEACYGRHGGVRRERGAGIGWLVLGSRVAQRIAFPRSRMPILLFKLNQDCRCRIPRPRPGQRCPNRIWVGADPCT